MAFILDDTGLFRRMGGHFFPLLLAAPRAALTSEKRVSSPFFLRSALRLNAPDRIPVPSRFEQLK